MDFGQLWEDLKEKTGSAVDDALKTGWPAVQSGLEQWGIDVLKKQNAETQKTLENNVHEIMTRPATSVGVSDYIKNAMQGPILKEYGGLIVAGVVGILVVGMYLRK